jgi:DNA polymerase III delta prime subunit
VRQGVKALTLFYGPSGSGKTYSAIQFTRGLVGPNGRIAFLDTEAGRGSHYAHLTGYDIMDLAPPFTPARYLEAIEAAEDAGYDALIIDSISHGWEGEGGVLEQAERIELNSGRAGLHCWAKPKAQHKKLINRLLRSRLHLIFCARAREKPKQVKDSRGKTEIVSEGFEPIVEKNFPFEMLLSVGFSDTAPGVPDFALKKKIPGELAGAFPQGSHVGLRAGEFVSTWLDGGAPVDHAFRAAAERGREAARGGKASLTAWWRDLDPSERKALEGMAHSELRSIAMAADDLAELGNGASADAAPSGPRHGPKGDLVRDINDDIEDPEPGETPSQPGEDAGEDSAVQASQADASPEQSPEPASGDASAAQSDDEQPEGAKRFYAATMKEIRAATTLGQRENALKGAKANGYWDMLTDEQRAAINKAGA